jgi:2-keto-3-deoxy-L-rhamnonate aldolase RhmA
MLQNKLKERLSQGEAVFGLGLTGPVEVPVLRVLSGCGVEWAFLDMEHGSLGIDRLLEVVQVGDALGLYSVVRVPDLGYHWIARALDTGALSVMIPRVETHEQAVQAVKWAKFPPLGVRGMGSPSYLSYAPVSLADGVEISNRETMIVLQIESQKAVDNVETIAAVPGVDVLFIGPVDLSISIGRPGETRSPEIHERFRKVCQAARAHGLAVGTVCRAEQTQEYYGMGIRMFSVGTALGYLGAGVQAAMGVFREQIGRGQGEGL